MAAHRRGAGDPKSFGRRLAQTAWTIAYLDDLASDFSAVHHIHDMTRLSGPAFFRLAFRLPAYEGVMQARVRDLLEDDDGSPAVQQQAAPERRTVVPATRAALQADPAFQGIISFG